MAKIKKKVKKTPGAFNTASSGGFEKTSVIPEAKTETIIKPDYSRATEKTTKPKSKTVKPEPAPVPKKHPPMDLTLFCAKANCRKWECRLAARAEMERVRTGKTKHTFLEWKAMVDRERNAKG